MEARTTQSASGTLPLALQIGRRRLIVRDSLKFLTLTAVAVLMSGITAFLFRSFESRREDLAIRWAQRGRDALHHDRPVDAVQALRISLSYHPDDQENELALAEALAASGHANEAENYYVNLWQARPGDGLINLQLGRLERTKGDARSAIDHYRAAVFGTWQGDAVARRRDTRMELSKYLIERGQLQAARAELTIAAGNNPDATSQLAIGQLLESAADPRDALTAYRNAEQDTEQAPVAEARAGELCHKQGDYGCASDLLERALKSEAWTAEQKDRMTGLMHDSGRLQELAFGLDLSPAVRISHLLNDVRLAQARMKACMATDADTAGLAKLQAQWKDLDTARSRAALRRDDDLQDQYGSLLWETEAATTAACGTPTGDDALLLYLRANPAMHMGAE